MEIRKSSNGKKNNDFGQLLEMEDELEIDIELSNELIDEMNKQCNAVVNNINTIKTTTAWTWTLSTTRTRGITTIHISTLHHQKI